MRRISKVGDLLKFLYNKGVDSIIQKLMKYDLKSTSIKEEEEIKQHIDDLFQDAKEDQFGNIFNIDEIRKYGDIEYTLRIRWSNHAKERSYLRADKIGFTLVVNEDIVNKLMEDIQNGKKIEADKTRSTEESGKKILVGNFEYVRDIRNVVAVNDKILVSISVVTVINKNAKMEYNVPKGDEWNEFGKKFREKYDRNPNFKDIKKYMETREI